ncbi:hypothetical protein Thal_1299 [Thermocrinis albus DSM 14484]|uniref:Major facilitator superfamily MFS_1 n=1 Tax=Thermocrinis albus (strain DSM 14484 / JCM 11386 / HI 11/12) TaxID=638303 RepID=D3SMF0_THEAH|nr:hypothetical protein [Thermocrinis albus]ADC89930.1 hypothetical protein Thal_1299 [Thermocrinis albus DSM 14484]
MLYLLLYVAFEFTDTLFTSYLFYYILPGESYQHTSTIQYGLLLTWLNLLGLITTPFLSRRPVLLLPLTALVVGLLLILHHWYLIALLYVLHIPLMLWYDVVISLFERYSFVAGLSYAFGFVGAGLVLMNFSQRVFLLTGGLYMLHLLLLFPIARRPVDLRFRLFPPMGRAEILAFMIMGELVEVFTFFSYRILKDSFNVSEDNIRYVMALALLSACVSSLILGYLLDFLKPEVGGLLTSAFLLVLGIAFFSRVVGPYLLGSLAGVGVALYWVLFRTYLIRSYPNNFSELFFFMFASSYTVGGFVYSTLYSLTADHRYSVLLMSLALLQPLYTFLAKVRTTR